MADRLFDSLQVDSSKARELLGWKPVVSMDEGLVALRKGASVPSSGATGQAKTQRKNNVKKDYD